MNYEELMTDIKSRKLKRSYIFYGEEEYLMDYSLTLLKKEFVDKDLESLNYVVIEGKEADFDMIFNACETLPFMSEKKIVVVKDLNIFSRKKSDEGRTVKNSSFAELGDYIQTLDNYVCLIFIEKQSGVDNSLTLVKKIKKVGDSVNFSRLKGKILNDFVKKVFEEYGKVIDLSNIRYFIDSSSYFGMNTDKNLYDLKNEIGKISEYAGNKKKILKEDIDVIMSRTLENNIFKLLDNIAQKNTDDSLRLLNEMYLAGEPILRILYMIIRQIRFMLMYKLSKKMGYDNKKTLEKLNIKEREFENIRKKSENFSEEQLKKALNFCADGDRNIKTGIMEEKLALEMLVVQLCVYNQ